MLAAFVRRLPTETWLWLLALATLACADPTAAPLLDLCPLKALGATWCPGCGLGHAVAFLLDGQWSRSWQAHPLGLPALLILAGRVTRSVVCAYAALQRQELRAQVPHASTA